MRYFITSFFLVLYSFLQAQVYVPNDALSKVSFKIDNFGSAVNGSFKGLRGTINFNSSKLATSVFDVTINVATIDTGIGMRDNHLLKPDYFGVADSPTIRFVSSKVVKSDKLNEAIVTGKLTIKKTTKEISFPFQYSEVKGVMKFTGEFKIDRRDFGIGGNSFSLANDLTVLLDVRASK